MQVTALNDQQLIGLYLEGNEKAFEELLSRHKTRIYTTIFLFVKDSALAEDIFQDVFIKIVRTLREGKYNHEGKFVQWATRIAHNLCVDYHRRMKRRPIVNNSPVEGFDIFNVIPMPDESVEDRIMRSQTHENLRELINSLPQEQREVVILRHFAELSFKEIAGLTRVSINTALGRMRYALINIRRMVEEKEVTL